MARSSPSICSANSRSCSDAPAQRRASRGVARRVEDDEIGLLAGQERADAIGDAHHARAARGGEMKRAEGIEAGAPAAGRSGTPRRACGARERRRARADIGADADPDAVTIGLRQIEQARAEEHVAGRAEGDAGARLGHARQRPVAHVDAMGEDRARPDQAEPVVDVEIVARPRGSARRRRRSRPDFRRGGCASARRDARRPALPASASCSSLEVGAKRGVTA